MKRIKFLLFVGIQVLHDGKAEKIRLYAVLIPTF